MFLGPKGEGFDDYILLRISGPLYAHCPVLGLVLVPSPSGGSFLWWHRKTLICDYNRMLLRVILLLYSFRKTEVYIHDLPCLTFLATYKVLRLRLMGVCIPLSLGVKTVSLATGPWLGGCEGSTALNWNLPFKTFLNYCSHISQRIIKSTMNIDLDLGNVKRYVTKSTLAANHNENL